MDAMINTIMENLRALTGRESIDSIRTPTRFDHINITDWSVNETILKPLRAMQSTNIRNYGKLDFLDIVKYETS
jgi:hypothetical protein